MPFVPQEIVVMTTYGTISDDKVVIMTNSGSSGVHMMHVYDSRAYSTGLILGLRPASERRRYKVTPSLIVWAQT